MSIELTFKFSTVDNAKSFMQGLGKKSKEALEAEPVATVPAEPVDLSPGPVETAIAEAQPVATTSATEAAASDIAGMLGLGGAAPAPVAAAPAPTAAAPAPVAPVAPPAPPVVEQPVPPPAPEPPPEGVDQKSIISAFTMLGQSKGRDAIAGLLAELGVTTVVEIQPEQYVGVLNRINQLLQG